MLSSMCQHVARLQFVSRAEKDSLCAEFHMFGSMPWCKFPWHKLLPRLAQENCHTTVWIWSMSLHPCFRLRWLLQDVAGLPRKAFPRKQAFVDISVVLCLRKQQPRFAQGQPKGYFLTKRLDRTTEAIARMNIVWEGPVCWVQCANMWQDCSLSAVQRKTACVEQSWWPEFEMFGSMPWCSFPWHKLLPRLAQKTCNTTVWIWSMSLHPCFCRRWLLQGCLGKPSHGSRPL